MVALNDQLNLDQHLIQASQYLKERSEGWTKGMDPQKALLIEQRLFASVSLLSDYAESQIVDCWPTEPWALKVSLIAAFQSNANSVFVKALDKLQELIKSDHADHYVSALWLGNPSDLTAERLKILLSSDLLHFYGVQNFHQCVWSEQTMRQLALHFKLPLPAWMQLTDNLKYSPDQLVKRLLILRRDNAFNLLRNQLKLEPSETTTWLWLTLSEKRLATELFFKHCLDEPHHLLAASLQGSSTVIDKLLSFVEMPTTASYAMAALENILALPIEWQAPAADPKTGEVIVASSTEHFPLRSLMKSNQSILFQGKEKDAFALSQWLLKQPSCLQSVAWCHLSQILGVVLPDLSRHWVHVQKRILQKHVLSGKKVNYAA